MVKKKDRPSPKKPAIKSQPAPTGKQPVADDVKSEKKIKGAETIKPVPFDGDPDAPVNRQGRKPGAVGGRGPDRAPRKTRSDRGVKKTTPAEEAEAEKAEIKSELQEQVEQDAEAVVTLSPEVRAQLLTRALVTTIDVTICGLLKPHLTAAEKAVLVDAWHPVIFFHLDRLGGVWGLALVTTVLVFTPRFVLMLARLWTRWKKSK